jgi:hypothetical protein
MAVVGGWMLACGSGELDIEEGGDQARPAEPEPAADAPPAAEEGKAKQAQLVSLEQGDIACYVELKTKDGEELFLHGDFELCPGGGADASGLIGKRVRYKTETTKVQAGSCEGDPECTDTEEVPLIVALKPAK